MAKRISPEVVEKIVSLFEVDMNDADIAGECNVSISYVNKLRNNYKNMKKSKYEKEYLVHNNTESMDEVALLEMKINSLKQSLKWYEELLSMKKK